MYTIECFERRSGPRPAFYCIPSKVKFMAFTCTTPTSGGSLNAVSQLLKLKTRSSFQACLCLICVSLNIKDCVLLIRAGETSSNFIGSFERRPPFRAVTG